MIEIRDVITLDDNNEYVVASIANYENKKYYYLIDINNHQNILFCYEENETLVESIDKDINTKLLPLFYKNGKDILEEYNN